MPIRAAAFSRRLLAICSLPIAAGLWLFLPARSGADSVTLIATSDTRVTPTEDTNWDFLHSDAVYHEPGNVQQSLIQFDLSSVPAGAKITSASLRMTERDTQYTSQGNPTWAYRVTRAWGETQATGFR